MPSKPRSQRKLDRIDIDELFSSPSNRGMLSFLERPPEEARLRLEGKRKVDALHTVCDSPTASDLGTVSALSDPPLVYTELPTTAHNVSQTQTALDSLTVGDSHTERKLPAVGESLSVDKPSEGGPLLVNRRQKVRRAVNVQDGHSSGEQLLYQALWNAAKPETAETRLISAGYQAMSFLCKLEKSNCKKNILGLISKLSVEIADKYDSEARIGTTYRIFSYKEILRRREAAGLLWVIRTSGVRFVLPDENVSSESHTVGNSHSVRNSPAEGKSHMGPVGDLPMGTVGKSPTLIGIKENKQSSTIFTAVIQILQDEIGHADDEAAQRIVTDCRNRAPDATDEEIAFQVRSQARRLMRNHRVSNPMGLIIKQVPKHFEGESFRRRREHRLVTVEAQRTDWKQTYEAVLRDPAASEQEKRVAEAALSRL